MPPTADSAVPTLIAQRYEVGPLLGRGGMADVHAGTDRRLMRPVAIKLLQERMAARPEIRARFETEAQAAARLSHPAAVAVYDTGEHEGVPYIVMERLPGETLADRMAAGPVDPEWLRMVSAEVLAALGAAHAAGLVHRDVKPGNILITEDGHAKIADFGIAKSIDAAAAANSLTAMADLTGSGQLLGTPAYVAPERIEGRPASASSDIYGLGVVMYEALAGVKPFQADTPLATAGKVVAGEHTPLRDLRPDLDPALTAAVETAMSADPSARFATAAAMAAALTTSGVTVAMDPDPTLVREPTMVLDAADLREEGAGARDAPVAVAAARAHNRQGGVGPMVPGRAGSPTAWLVVLAALALLAFLLVAQLGSDDTGSDDVETTPSSTVTTAAPTTRPATRQIPPSPTTVDPGLDEDGPTVDPGIVDEFPTTIDLNETINSLLEQGGNGKGNGKGKDD